MPDKIKFSTNVPVELALKFTEGKLCDSQFGDPQYLFTTTDDRVFFVAEKVAQKIHGLRLKPGEPIDVCKAEVDWGKGRKGIEWQISRVGTAPVGEQPNGTFVVPQAPAAPTPVSVTQPAPTHTDNTNNGHGSRNGAAGHGQPASAAPAIAAPAWAAHLVEQTTHLIDAFALASKHASERHGNLVKTEDVRSLLLSAFINLSKSGGAHVQ